MKTEKLHRSRRILQLLIPLIGLILCLSPSMLVWANQVSVTGTYNYDAARQMLDLVNQTRAAAGMPALAYDYGLEDYAKQRAAELTVLNSHVRPDGTNVPYSENYSIGWGSVTAAHNAFVGSTSHYSTMVGSYTTMAGACLVANGQTYWVQVYSQNAYGGAPNGLAGMLTETRTVNAQATNLTAHQYENLDDVLTLKVGAYIKANVGIEGQATQASWYSDKPNVASVDGTGKITGISPGVCLVTCDLGVTSARIQVTVITTGAAAVAPPPTAAPNVVPTVAPTLAPTAAPTLPLTTQAPPVPEAPLITEASVPPSLPETVPSLTAPLATEATALLTEPTVPPAAPSNLATSETTASWPGQASGSETSKGQETEGEISKASRPSSDSRKGESEASPSSPAASSSKAAATSLAQKSFLAMDDMSDSSQTILLMASIVGIVVASSLIVLVAKSGH